MRYTGPTPAVLAVVNERDGYRCMRCGRKGTNKHHRIGRGAGGTRNPAVNAPDAIVTLCGSGVTGCHGWVETHPADAYVTGWKVRRNSYDRPADIPLTDVYGRVFFLTVEGGVHVIADPGEPPF